MIIITITGIHLMNSTSTTILTMIVTGTYIRMTHMTIRTHTTTRTDISTSRWNRSRKKVSRRM